MYINDSTNPQNSIYHYTLFLLGLDSTDTTSYAVADFIRSANSWVRKAVFLSWRNSDAWEFDDSNYSTLPIATTTLVNEQADYSLPSNGLDVERVEVLDSSGNYKLLTQLDKGMVDSAMTEYYETPGMPAYYDLVGNSLVLYPKPSASYVTVAAGLKLYLARDIDGFTTLDTSQEPGFVPTFHPYVAYGSALDYAIAKNIDVNKVSVIKLGLNEYQSAIQDYYAKRNKDSKVKIRPRTKSNI